MLQGLDREHCLLTSVDIKHRVLAVTTVSIGSDGHTFMAPREIFRDALAHGASAVILAHNHPSGDPEPSRDDELVTRRLHKAGELLGIDVLDHLVIGANRWISLARRGALA
jgi:DNA repair protein RadC